VPRGGRRTYDQAGASPSILVADAYEGARVPAARYLERFHFDVSNAADAQQVLQRISTTHPPQVILSDWSLPTLPARRLVQVLEQNGRTRNIPVIVMVDDYEPGEGMPPVAGILVKPFSLAVMLDEIRRVIRNRRANAA
jgi:CheY-like chemotaxis protein